MQCLVSGLVLSLIAGALGLAAFQSDTTGLIWASWVAAGVGGAMVFIGLVAIAVEMGIRSSR